MFTFIIIITKCSFILRSLTRIRFPPLAPPVCTELGTGWVSLNSILYQTINTISTLLLLLQSSQFQWQLRVTNKCLAHWMIPPSTILNNSSKLFTLFFFGVFRRQSLNINWLCNQKINVLVNKAQKTHLLQEKRKMLIFKITYFWLECVYVRLSVCHVPLGIIQLTPHSIGAHSPCLQRSGVSPFHFTQ